MDKMRVHPYHICDFPNGIAKDGAMAILTGSAAPGTDVPDFVGQMYIDTTNDIAYIAISTEASGFLRVTNA